MNPPPASDLDHVIAVAHATSSCSSQIRSGDGGVGGWPDSPVKTKKPRQIMRMIHRGILNRLCRGEDASVWMFGALAAPAL